MANDATVGVKSAATPDALVDNSTYTKSATTVVRQRVEDPRNAGTPAYHAGTGGGTPSIPAGARVLGISAYANNADGTITINAGDTITVRVGLSWAWNPLGNLIAPTIVFSSSLDYFVEYVTGDGIF